MKLDFLYYKVQRALPCNFTIRTITSELDLYTGSCCRAQTRDEVDFSHKISNHD